MKKRGRSGRVARKDSGATRERLFAAAAAEFAARGFAGAKVDRIAHAARVNKAMLYYHFQSKAGVYAEILHDMFQAVADRLHRSTPAGASPEDRIRVMVEAIAREAESRPHFPAIWLRELAEGGAHVDKGTMAIVAGILQQVIAAVKEGIASKRFVPANPLLVQFGIVGPLLMFFATAPLRRKAPAPRDAAIQLTTEQVIAHVQRVTLLTLQGKHS
jgi:AcrR family transcriptional regulator